jgi:hypothetical protein
VDIIINLRAIKNFILLNIVFIFKINIKVKITPYKLLIINGKVINNNKGIVNVKINELIIKMFKGHLKFINFNIVIIRRYKVILKVLWI